MLQRFRKVDNPLTIIAIFAGITEVAAAVALRFLHQDMQNVFVWFLIGFPFVLIIAFFLTLNFNARVLYAPGDYRDDKAFLEALRLSGDTPQLSVTSADDVLPSIQTVKQDADRESAMSPFDGVTQAELDCVNKVFSLFRKNSKSLFESKLVKSLIFSIQGEGLFLLAATCAEGHHLNVESRIIRATTLPDDRVELTIIGKGIRSTQPEEFARILFLSLRDGILKRKEKEPPIKAKEPN